MFSKLLLAAALVGVANAQTCSDIDGAGGGALTCLANSVADGTATGTSCTGTCTQAKDNDKCCTPNTGYSSDATADNNAITANSCTGGTLTQPSNGVLAGTVADPIVTGTDVSANIVGDTGYTCTGTALAVCTTAGANAVTTTGRTCAENTCNAKADAAAWAALGVTVTTNDAATVTGLGTIGEAGNYFGTASVTCPTDGGDFSVSGVTACTTVANAADPTAVTCTDATDSQMTGACATGYTKNTAGTADTCLSTHTCTCTDGTAAVGAACTTDEAWCASCNAGFYLDAGACTQQQACSDASSGTCTNSAIKRDSNLCATATCGGSDFGDTSTACCVECLVNANCSDADYPKCAKAGTADPWTCVEVGSDDATCLAIDADKPTWYTNVCGCATGEWAATADAACAAATVCGLDIDGNTQRSATGDANHTFAGTCVACTSGWAATAASDCDSHTNVTTCTGKQADGTARKVAGTATADASCTACADGTAAANWMTDCASTATTTPAPAATTTPAPKTSIDPGTEDSAATATLGVASALAAAAAFARLL